MKFSLEKNSKWNKIIIDIIRSYLKTFWRTLENWKQNNFYYLNHYIDILLSYYNEMFYIFIIEYLFQVYQGAMCG